MRCPSGPELRATRQNHRNEGGEQASLRKEGAKKCSHNRVGGGLSAPVLPRHRTYSPYPAASTDGSTSRTERDVKARLRAIAADRLGSSGAPVRVPPSPVASGLVAGGVSVGRISRSAVFACRFPAVELSRSRPCINRFGPSPARRRGCQGGSPSAHAGEASPGDDRVPRATTASADFSAGVPARRHADSPGSPGRPRRPPAVSEVSFDRPGRIYLRGSRVILGRRAPASGYPARLPPGGLASH